MCPSSFGSNKFIESDNNDNILDLFIEYLIMLIVHNMHIFS